MDTSHDDAQLMVAALSDAQLLRAYGHADRGRAVADLTQARRAEMAAPSPDAVREAEARQLVAVTNAVVGPLWRRCRRIKRATTTLQWLWLASGVPVALIFWLDDRSSGALNTLGGAALAVSFCILMASAICRIAYLRRADRFRTSVIESALEWASSQPKRLGRGLDGLPNLHGGYEAGDRSLYDGSGILCMMLGVIAPVIVFADGHTAGGYISLAVITLPLVACGLSIILSYHRMERRQDRACELIAALANPSPEERIAVGDLRIFAAPRSGRRNRDAARGDRDGWKGVR